MLEDNRPTQSGRNALTKNGLPNKLVFRIPMELLAASNSPLVNNQPGVLRHVRIQQGFQLDPWRYT